VPRWCRTSELSWMGIDNTSKTHGLGTERHLILTWIRRTPQPLKLQLCDMHDIAAKNGDTVSVLDVVLCGALLSSATSGQHSLVDTRWQMRMEHIPFAIEYLFKVLRTVTHQLILRYQKFQGQMHRACSFMYYRASRQSYWTLVGSCEELL
jgi:hypothetical protein